MRPIFVRELTEQERRILEQGLHSSSAFTVRRCQVLLSSAAGKTANQIAEELHCFKSWAAGREDCMLMDQDECWFSRFAQPRMHSWAAKGEELRLVQRQPKPQEPDKALACFGAVRQDTGERFLYFSDGQPDTERTILMLERLLEVARREKKRVLVIIWDRASWHKSQKLKEWQHRHNRKAKRDGDVRLLTCLLPVKSPWLNPMEAHRVHAKRAVVEPDGELPATELRRRLCAHFEVALETSTLQ